MLSATLTGMISASFEPQIAVIPMLVSFMPMVMGTGGNCGSQSSTLIIRGMAIDEIRLRDFFKVVFKEFRIALICAAVLSVVNSLRVLITYKDPALALVIGLSLIGTVVIAKLVGAMLPMGAKALRLPCHNGKSAYHNCGGLLLAADIFYSCHKYSQRQTVKTAALMM